MIGPRPCTYACAYVDSVFTSQSYDISISTRRTNLSVFLVLMLMSTQFSLAYTCAFVYASAYTYALMKTRLIAFKSYYRLAGIGGLIRSNLVPRVLSYQSPLETRSKPGRADFHREFWYSYWRSTGQLLANFCLPPVAVPKVFTKVNSV